MKRSVHVKIAGHDLALRSDAGNDYVQALAAFVDARVDELTKGRRAHSPQRVALLVALEFADALFREKDLHRRYRQTVRARMAELEQALHEHAALVAQASQEASHNSGDGLEAHEPHESLASHDAHEQQACEGPAIGPVVDAFPEDSEPESTAGIDAP